MWPRRIDDNILFFHSQFARDICLFDHGQGSKDILKDHLEELLDVGHDYVVDGVLIGKHFGEFLQVLLTIGLFNNEMV